MLLSGFISVANIARATEAQAEGKLKGIVGIDLGTTFSCAAIYYPDLNTYGYVTYGQDLHETIPSTVYVDGYDAEKKAPVTYVGYEANMLNQSKINANGYYYGFKRMMGIADVKATDYGLDQFENHVQYKVQRKVGLDSNGGVTNYYVFPYYPRAVGDDASPYEKSLYETYTKQGKAACEFTPTELSSIVLRAIKERLDEMNVEVVSTVISTPAYFTEPQRTQTITAAIGAGFGQVELTNEPKAACAYYAVSNEAAFKDNTNEVALVFDFGGGTLDVTVVDLTWGTESDASAPEKVCDVVVETYVANNFLGGENINKQLAEYFESKMRMSFGKDLKLTSVDLLRLHLFADSFKIALCNKALEFGDTDSATTATHTDTFLFSQNKRIEFTLSEAEFNSICKPVFDRIENVLGTSSSGLLGKKSKSGTTVNADDINKVVLVGGSTRVPQVRRILKRLFKKAKHFSGLDADKSVARGACELAIKDKHRSGVSLAMFDVAPLSLGIRVEGDILAEIINKDDRIPITSKMDFTTTADNQTEILVEVAAGFEKVFANNTYLGKLRITLKERLPRGVPQIEVSMHLDEQNRVSVSARDKSSDEVPVTATFKLDYDSSLSKEKIKEMEEKYKKNAENDAKVRELATLYPEVSSLISGFSKLISSCGLPKEEVDDLNASLKISEDWFEMYKYNWSLDPALVKDKKESLSKEMDDLRKRMAEYAASNAAGGAEGSKPEEIVEEAAKEAGREVL